jgi:hypothetical protein
MPKFSYTGLGTWGFAYINVVGSLPTGAYTVSTRIQIDDASPNNVTIAPLARVWKVIASPSSANFQQAAPNVVAVTGWAQASAQTYTIDNTYKTFVWTLTPIAGNVAFATGEHVLIEFAVQVTDMGANGCDVRLSTNDANTYIDFGVAGSFPQRLYPDATIPTGLLSGSSAMYKLATTAPGPANLNSSAQDVDDAVGSYYFMRAPIGSSPSGSNVVFPLIDDATITTPQFITRTRLPFNEMRMMV